MAIKVTSVMVLPLVLPLVVLLVLATSSCFLVLASDDKSASSSSSSALPGGPTNNNNNSSNSMMVMNGNNNNNSSTVSLKVLFVAYLAMDNNLMCSGRKNLAELVRGMQSLTNDDDEQIVVLALSDQTGSRRYNEACPWPMDEALLFPDAPESSGMRGTWNGPSARLVQITKQGIVAPMRFGRQFMWSERNTADPIAMANLLNDILDAYPAEHTVLSIGSHGAGWLAQLDDMRPEGAGHCATMGNCQEEMALVDFAYAIQAGSRVHRWDLLILDMCRMAQVEVMDVLCGVDIARYIVASQLNVPAAGHDYVSIVQQLARLATMSTNDDGDQKAYALAVSAVRSFATKSENGPSWDAGEVTMAVVNCSAFGRLSNSIQAYIDKITAIQRPYLENSYDRIEAIEKGSLPSPRSSLAQLWATLSRCIALEMKDNRNAQTNMGLGDGKQEEMQVDLGSWLCGSLGTNDRRCAVEGDAQKYEIIPGALTTTAHDDDDDDEDEEDDESDGNDADAQEADQMKSSMDRVDGVPACVEMFLEHPTRGVKMNLSDADMTIARSIAAWFNGNSEWGSPLSISSKVEEEEEEHAKISVEQAVNLIFNSENETQLNELAASPSNLRKLLQAFNHTQEVRALWEAYKAALPYFVAGPGSFGSTGLGIYYPLLSQTDDGSAQDLSEVEVQNFQYYYMYVGGLDEVADGGEVGGGLPPLDEAREHLSNLTTWKSIEGYSPLAGRWAAYLKWVERPTDILTSRFIRESSASAEFRFLPSTIQAWVSGGGVDDRGDPARSSNYTTTTGDYITENNNTDASWHMRAVAVGGIATRSEMWVGWNLNLTAGGEEEGHGDEKTRRRWFNQMSAQRLCDDDDDTEQQHQPSCGYIAWLVIAGATSKLVSASKVAPSFSLGNSSIELRDEITLYEVEAEWKGYFVVVFKPNNSSNITAMDWKQSQSPVPATAAYTSLSRKQGARIRVIVPVRWAPRCDSPRSAYRSAVLLSTLRRTARGYRRVARPVLWLDIGRGGGIGTTTTASKLGDMEILPTEEVMRLLMKSTTLSADGLRDAAERAGGGVRGDTIDADDDDLRDVIASLFENAESDTPLKTNQSGNIFYTSNSSSSDTHNQTTTSGARWLQWGLDRGGTITPFVLGMMYRTSSSEESRLGNVEERTFTRLTDDSSCLTWADDDGSGGPMLGITDVTEFSRFMVKKNQAREKTSAADGAKVTTLLRTSTPTGDSAFAVCDVESTSIVNDTNGEQRMSSVSECMSFTDKELREQIDA
ncbi:clostripain family [Pycnococcus provasolii]